MLDPAGLKATSNLGAHFLLLTKFDAHHFPILSKKYKLKLYRISDNFLYFPCGNITAHYTLYICSMDIGLVVFSRELLFFHAYTKSYQKFLQLLCI